MKGTTHTLVGAAVVLPLALQHDPALAAGCFWIGMAGAGLPDWLDLRSDFRSTLRHRGASHSVVALVLCVAATWGVLWALQGSDVRVGRFAIAPRDPVPEVLAIALALGFASHLAADACTVSGIRPLLPFSNMRLWLLPRPLRGRTGGPLDTAVGWLAVTVLSFGLVLAAAKWLGVP